MKEIHAKLKRALSKEKSVPKKRRKEKQPKAFCELCTNCKYTRGKQHNKGHQAKEVRGQVEKPRPTRAQEELTVVHHLVLVHHWSSRLSEDCVACTFLIVAIVAALTFIVLRGVAIL